MKVFVAGATGATGQVFLPMAEKAGITLTLHVRPKSRDKSPLGSDPRAAIFDLSDEAALDAALRGHDAIVSFVGTMRNRFSQGDDYASSDVASAKSLGDAAERVGVPRILLLSSIGAGGAGAYLKMKLECEAAIQRPGIAWTVFRPSVLVSPDWAADGTHGKRRSPPGLSALFAGLGCLPGLRGFADDTKPIPLERVCQGFVDALLHPDAYHDRVVLGRDLWKLPMP